MKKRDLSDMFANFGDKLFADDGEKAEGSFSGEVVMETEDFVDFVSSIGSEYEPIDEEVLEGREWEDEC